MFQTTIQWSNGDVATANLIRWDQWQHPQRKHHRDWLNDWIGLMEDKPGKSLIFQGKTMGKLEKPSVSSFDSPLKPTQ
jgi:hypothetical protein